MRIDKTMYDYDPAYSEGYDDGYDDGYCNGHKAASDLYLAECKRLCDCLRAILGDGEAPARVMDDGSADNRREERTAPSADGIRA